MMPGARILLVEDELLVAGMLTHMLMALGYSVAGPTADLNEALDIVDREKVDAVLLDINLNGVMSYSFAECLRARGMPFIFATGYQAASLPIAFASQRLLKKPFRRSALGESLATFLPDGDSARV